MRLTGGTLGTKAVTLSDFDNWLDAQIDRGGGADPQDLYKAVAWTYWAVNLRANNVSQIPYAVYPESVDEQDETEENAVKFEIDLAPMLWQVEAWMQLHAAAYVLKQSNRVIVKALQVLNANTMKVQEYDADGPTVFRQKVGSQHKDYPADEILYFRTWSPSTDINPGVAGGDVGSKAAELIQNANEWATSFFGNGAVPAVLLTSDQPLTPNIIDEVETRWDRMLKGVRRAWKTKALGSGLKPMIVGQPVKDLAMPELEETRRNQILAAHGIPPGLGDVKTNRAERDALQYEFWDSWIKPYCGALIVPVLNEGLFKPQGLRLSFQYHKIEALQKEEIAKSESAAFMVNGVMIPAYEANLVSVEESRAVISSILGMAALPVLEAAFTPENRTPAMPAPGAGGNDGEGPGQSAPPGENTGENTRPKALAPKWGRHRVSLRN